jgi:hypothetical protein
VMSEDALFVLALVLSWLSGFLIAFAIFGA